AKNRVLKQLGERKNEGTSDHASLDDVFDHPAARSLFWCARVTHFEAADTRAKEYVSLLKSNDPVGFNLVDVLAWGSIGHIVAYYILATTSNGYDPKFFG
ncbi:Photosystem I PsaG/PsaK protein, partial [Sesbania bispinosa]